ncbi:MAG TPA: hypothetical protein DCS93_02100 [Microscillaceae bacterium]|nr:hypothetical protein [Microscillaceae bacterium]
MNWLYYILNFTICQAFLWAFYRVFLEKESLHTTKRYYLLLIVPIAVVIPLVTFPVYEVPVKVLSVQVDSFRPLVHAKPIFQAGSNTLWPTFLWLIYFGGVLIFGLRFIRNLLYLITQIANSHKVKVQHLTHVLISQEVIPHAFLRYVFLNKDWYTHQRIPQEVLIHEEAHARQLHSIDLLFAEFLRVVLWFNPFIYFMKNSMQLNHEFLADRYVLDRGITKGSYQESILELSIIEPQHLFSNAFNHSFIKKRFLMMQKRSSNTLIYLKATLLLFLVSALLMSFSKRSVKAAQVQSPRLNMVHITKNISDPISEYNRLAKYYNQYPKIDFVKKVKDMWKIRNLYESISASKRALLEKYPVSATELSIFITNDGKYLIDKREVSLTEIGSLFKTLSVQERSNIYVFDEKQDYQVYIKHSRANKTKIPNNNVFVRLCSDEIIDVEALNLFKVVNHKNKNLRVIDYAAANKKLKAFVQQLHKTLEQHQIKVNR